PAIKITSNLIDWSTIINGFTITSIWECGIYLIIASPTISDNIIYMCSRAAIKCYNSSPIISNNIIKGCNCDWYYNYGIVTCSNSSAYIYDNLFIDNYTQPGFSGVIYCEQSSPIINHNTITSNDGISIYCCDSSSPLISNNTISQNYWYYGIECRNNSSPIIDSNTISMNRGGITCSDSANPVINYNNIIDNFEYGVLNEDSNVTVDARYNWWGDASGPYHPDSNPGGLGDSVSDYVNFTPWLDAPFGIVEHRPIPTKFTALQIYPNPFREKTDIRYVISDNSIIDLKIYDITGCLVREFRSTPDALCSTQFTWDGCDDAGNRVPSSIYFIKFSAGDYRETRKLVLLK
ncbi:hypothetical protein AMJ52_07270, partial [candidate division TA06 bacterium DG_78]